MVERDNVTAIEAQLQGLNAEGRRALDERNAQIASIESLRATIERLRIDLRTAEAAVHERKQPASSFATDFDRGDVERQLAELIEVEQMTRKRRALAEQRALGFRAAATFAAAARIEAERGGDKERADRELVVEDRSAREA